VADKTYIVTYANNRDPRDRSTQELVRGSRVEEDSDGLWFIKEDGSVGAFFIRGMVREWREVSGDELAMLKRPQE
jgi:hypothetical protein